MKVSIWTQQLGPSKAPPLKERLVQQIAVQAYKAIWVSVAYATVAGVRQLLSALPAGQPSESWWLIGLDDEITHPGAIELLRSRPKAHLRVASYESEGARFHPKVYGFSASPKSPIQLALVGSANLTISAWSRNGEAVSVLETENSQDRKALDDMWLALWSQGHEISDQELQDYRDRYDAAAEARTHVKQQIIEANKKKSRAEILASDIAEVDPTLARTCWIEGGAITAMGRELEFKAEQGLFFGLDQGGSDSPETLKFLISNGNTISLRMVYQQNHMWRLQMNNQIPEVKLGLRPKLPNGKLGRSPYVAVFRKTEIRGIFDLEFMDLKSNKFAKLLNESARKGTVGHTTARQYGWF